MEREAWVGFEQFTNGLSTVPRRFVPQQEDLAGWVCIKHGLQVQRSGFGSHLLDLADNDLSGMQVERSIKRCAFA
jgi:hypothetical protein